MNDKTSVKNVKLVRQIGSKTDWSAKKNAQLVAAILALKNADEAKRFLRDLLTEAEIKEFGNRLEAASFVQRCEIQRHQPKHRLSSATIARIAKWLGGSLVDIA